MSHPNPQPKLPGHAKDNSGKWAFRAGIAAISLFIGSLGYVHLTRIYETNVRAPCSSFVLRSAQWRL